MKLIQLPLLGCLAFLLCHCGLSIEAACKAIITVQCEKTIECTPESIRKLKPELKDQASCEADVSKQINCDTAKACNGQPDKYSPANAQTCVGEVRALTCNDIISGQTEQKAPTCLKVCL